MTIDAVSYEYGSEGNPYLGRIALQWFSDERFIASYHHRALRSEWHGHLRPGSFLKVYTALLAAGFPNVPPLGELVAGESPLELGWLVDGTWHRVEVKEESTTFSNVITIASTILSVLDPNLAGMPSGETTPIIEQHLVQAPG